MNTLVRKANFDLAGMKKKDKGGKEIIVEMGLTVIAVALIVVFRTEIKSLVDTIMGQASTTISGLFTFV